MRGRSYAATGPALTCVNIELNHGCSDEYCPNCDNHFVIDALTPKAALKVEGEDARIDSR
jgi:hypothetical protein